MIKFNNRILFVGYGAVAHCALPILFKHIEVSPEKVTVMDFEDRNKELAPWIERGVTFVRKRITPGNLTKTLSKHLSAGDLLIDLAWNIDCCEILQWCHDHGVLYVNTSVEVWDPYAGAEHKHPTERTLYWRHMNIRRHDGEVETKPGPTAVLEHGANPGLISHFTKQGLLDIARGGCSTGSGQGPGRRARSDSYAEDRTFNRLAMKLGVKVIHCSERDTQISDRPKQVDEFVNTWSVEGFREEGTTTAEMGWGTHEKKLPPLRLSSTPKGPKNQICLARMGMNTWVRSWVPELLHPRHGRPPRRGVHDLRPAHGLGKRRGDLPPDGALRLLPVRRGHRLAATSCAATTTSCSRSCGS